MLGIPLVPTTPLPEHVQQLCEVHTAVKSRSRRGGFRHASHRATKFGNSRRGRSAIESHVGSLMGTALASAAPWPGQLAAPTLRDRRGGLL